MQGKPEAFLTYWLSKEQLAVPVRNTESGNNTDRAIRSSSEVPPGRTQVSGLTPPSGARQLAYMPIAPCPGG